MKKTSQVLIIAITLFLCCIAVPVSAVVLEVTVKGPVGTVMPSTNTLTINNPQQYGCNYPASGNPVCSWTPMNATTLTGTIPDLAALTVFKPGDLTVATSIGGAGETWIALAKLYGSRANEEYVTDIVGNIDSIPTPLIGDYAIIAVTVPDCTNCTGTTCTAKSTDVKIMSSGMMVMEKTLAPGETLTYNGRNDASSVTVTFVKGQALSASCPQVQQGMVGGIQPVSDYLVTVVPPISSVQTNIRTATTTRPEEALTAAALPTGATVASGTMVPATTTQKSDIIPIVVIGAVFVGGLILVRRRE